MRCFSIAAFCLTVGLLGLTAQSSGTLTIYYIDTEGGQSTLFVGPAGESLLVDTGNAGDRDLGRIVETLNGAGVTRIDHLWTTHYHGDHVGALLALARQVPVMRFYDHGAPNRNDRIVAPSLGEAATALLAKLVTDDHEIVTLIEGEGASAAETRRLTEWLHEHRPGVEAEVHHGGQPLYPYLLSIE